GADDDAPPRLGGGQPEKTGDRPRILDDDVAAQPSATRIIGALDGEQIGMTARCNPAEQAALGVDRQLSLFCFAEPLGGEVFGPGEQESGETKRERRLANAERAGQLV